MSTLTFSQANDDVLGPLAPPRRLYYVVMVALACGIAAALTSWMYQVRTGMGVAGISHPVGWGAYIGNFVFWVGIAHSGTLISAILHLVRARWRTAISRSAEAMTVFAVMTAGLFPLVHLGRLWVFYYILPYPSERQLWPNFLSPLVWDVCAVSTYFTVSVIFFSVGLLPDLAAARDRLADALGPDHPRARLYRYLSLGWSGAASQWRHYGRAYLFFAALATPLVVSVHSVVSWDFAMGLLPGWHSTIFPPYFVAGAIHSGLAMVLTLLIPMRRFLHLERLIRREHFDAVARAMIVTTLIVGYAYVIEPWMAWYSGDIFERQFAWWRATGWFSTVYWLLAPLNVVAPLCFVFRRVRRNLPALFVISILVNIGMWLERVFIVTGSTAHDFMPHAWGHYMLSWVEMTITFGSFTWFLFWFFGFSKLLPTVPLNEVKASIRAGGPEKERLEGAGEEQAERVGDRQGGVLAVFGDADDALAALRGVWEKGRRRVEVYSPINLPEANLIMGRPKSPVRFWTLGGALSGMVGGFGLAIGAALVNSLVVGGKPPVAIIPYCIVAFEGTILLGTIGNLTGLLIHARLGRPRLPACYDRRFSRDKYGLLVGCGEGEAQAAAAELKDAGAEETHVIR